MTDPVNVSGSAARKGDSEPAQLMIVGLGNPMMADDGIGHEVLKRLQQRALPNRVRLVAVDDDVLSLMQLWEGERAVWLVDAVSSHRPAGTLSVYEHEDVLGLPAWGVSVHHTSLGESVRWMLHALPEMEVVEFRLLGIEAGVVAPGGPLSPGVGSSISALADVVERETRKLRD
jgi:hydrogenase maturation protease